MMTVLGEEGELSNSKHALNALRFAQEMGRLETRVIRNETVVNLLKSKSLTPPTSDVDRTTPNNNTDIPSERWLLK